MAEPTFALGELVKLLVALGVTIGLFYALALFMKRLQVGTGRSGNLITVLAALPLGGKEKLWVVDVAGEKLVIGTTPGNVNCLHVLNGNAGASEATPSSFRQRPESSIVGDAPVHDEVAPSSFPRKRESSPVMDEAPMHGDATPSSFRRRPESSVVGDASETTLGPGLRRGDGRATASSPLGDGSAFSALLNKFRGGSKP